MGCRYNGPGNGLDLAHAIALDSDNNIYITGASTGIGTGQDFATVKYDDSGNVLWVNRYDGFAESDVAYDIAVDASGNAYVTGVANEPGVGRRYATIKYDVSGDQVWADTSQRGDSRAIVVDFSGSAYVTGGDSDGDYATVKYDTEGNKIWTRTYHNASDSAWAIAIDASGDVYVTGRSSSDGTPNNTNTDYATIKYDSAGSVLWVSRFNGPQNTVDQADQAFDIAVDSLGNAYVTGMSLGIGSLGDYATVKYDSSGNEVWVS